MSSILLALAMYAFPPLFLLLFYSLKNRRLVWLAIPASALTLLLCCGRALGDLEFLGMLMIPFALHTAAVSAVTALAALIKSRAKGQPNKRALVILSAVVCAGALGFVAHTALLEKSGGYRQAFDRPVFTQLTQIKPEDVVKIQLDVPGRIGRIKPENVPYRGDKTFFAGLEYAGSGLSGYAFEMPNLRGEFSPMLIATLQNGDFATFILCRDDIFEARYRDRVFYVKSPQLLAGIT
jgi:hypothetical protein